MWYATVKRYYDTKHPSYNDESLKIFVKAAMITVDQYETITGIDYVDAA
ncbi:XkdX family protein [Lysinibacillus sp. OL1_EC]|nr:MULTISPECIES: XkdX family protein [unclassified Lysinibacillus]MCM0627369.1 XkdX family protein [Lysinibacillus sp. OL1_EC]MCS5500867.1 XkdX family protein [Lysinibacillus sp. A4]TBV84879.1 XkdX family protein [Lysinibacillus sp. OL1]UKJ44282.1 XkdX family protein [Lysinibacillus sp. ACHW1.5]